MYRIAIFKRLCYYIIRNISKTCLEMDIKDLLGGIISLWNSGMVLKENAGKKK